MLEACDIVGVHRCTVGMTWNTNNLWDNEKQKF